VHPVWVSVFVIINPVPEPTTVGILGTAGAVVCVVDGKDDVKSVESLDDVAVTITLYAVLYANDTVAVDCDPNDTAEPTTLPVVSLYEYRLPACGVSVFVIVPTRPFTTSVGVDGVPGFKYIVFDTDEITVTEVVLFVDCTRAE
jgi:hypothetical protein